MASQWEKLNVPEEIWKHMFLFQSCCFLAAGSHCFVFHMCSLRVNLDMGKSAYGWMIMKDENIPGTVVRTSTIPEELGRLVYLLTDKTGMSANT